jgi:hypothetical protein
MMLKDYQIKMLKDFSGNEIRIISAGRGVGKSMLSAMTYVNGVLQEMPKAIPFEVLARSEVDGEMWYTVKCTREVGSWVREQLKEQWVNHINSSWLFHENNFDIDRELFALLKLTWS